MMAGTFQNYSGEVSAMDDIKKELEALRKEIKALKDEIKRLNEENFWLTMKGDK